MQSFSLANLRVCLHEARGSQVGEVTRGGSPHLSCKRDQIKKRDYMDRRVTQSKRVTSPTRSPPPPCKQTLNVLLFLLFAVVVFVIQKFCYHGNVTSYLLSIAHVNWRPSQGDSSKCEHVYLCYLNHLRKQAFKV